MKVAVVGATGLVGKVMLKVLQERNFPVTQIIPIASEASVGNKVVFNGKEAAVVSMEDGLFNKPEVALFSAGAGVSLNMAPRFAEIGTTVIDNSSAWRMHENIKLVVPEVNGEVLTREDKIIANPNCSTIQMVMALSPLHQAFKIKRIVVSTYQAVTGTGKEAVVQLKNERSGIEEEKVYPYNIDLNCLPHCDVFTENGYTKEEMKLVNETRKILNDYSIQVTATAVRVPVLGGHSESVNVEFERDYGSIDEVRRMLNEMPGVVVMDNISQNIYPMPLYQQNKDEVFVGRIRRDESQPNTLNMWIVSDNLRKGAATNAIQIAEYLIAKNLLG
ncbi:MAG: aspartate-semialdehyde dehydrogenase [Sphingobacteriales bacterium]|nr:MAG: aspartate-semialdehyde dehydrogenase [Sphingobacteriales bacterium]